ncbi:hypothetical protein SAY87_024866 [Trapa incisa]|uniref:Uncharacterized protein n=1 Tax=Trapa incisa TaxID=236973 RepID=A0AAN7JG95_9MYRT|nr:hypothetical protein SAY87_024866 [Trapa incisa]
MGESDGKEAREGDGPPGRVPRLHERWAWGTFFHIFYEGCLTNFEVGGEDQGGALEASKLYPEVRYTRMHEYLKLYA